MAHPEFDAIVVGARVAGAATAMLLGRAGLRVLLLDRQQPGKDTLSTHALMRGGVLQLSRWGLLDQILKRDTPVVLSTSFHYGPRELAIPLRTSPDVPGLIAPRRTVLDAVLVDAARRAGVDVRYGWIVRDVVRDNARVTGVVVEDEGGNPRMVRAGVVIGADGIGSSIARAVRPRVIRAGQTSPCTIYGYAPGWGDGGFHWYYRMAEEGQHAIATGVIPTNGGESCVFVSQPTSVFDAVLRHDVASGYHRLLGLVDPQVAARARDLAGHALHVFRGRPGFLREAFGPGWVLVGDAGFFKDPLTAHGITDALRDAEAAAAAVVRGTSADLQHYAAERDDLAHRLLDVTERIVRFDWNYADLEQHHRDLNAMMKTEVALLAGRGGDSPAPVPTAGKDHMELVSPPSR